MEWLEEEMDAQHSNMNRRSFVALAAAAAAVPIVAACGTNSSGSSAASNSAVTSPGTSESLAALEAELYANAKKEGQIVWYTSAAPTAANQLKAAFEAKFPGIKITYSQSNVSEAVQRLSQEQAAGVHTADVLGLSAPGQAHQFYSQGFIIPYKVHDYDAFPVTSRGDAQVFELYDKFLPEGAIVYNTNKMQRADVPTTLKGFANLPPSKYKGQVELYDVRVWPYTMNYVLWVQTDGRSMPQALAHLQPSVSTEGNVADQSLASGQYTISCTYNMQDYIILKASKAPIDFVVPEEGLYMQPGSHFAAANAPHPNAAKLFMEYIHSQEGQTVWCSSGVVPGRPDVTFPAGMEWTKTAKVVQLDFVKSFDNQQQLISQATSDLGLPSL
jgi:iron(III) transport system substrate-binding protein